ncbi:MAG: hypothetical protein RLZZ535_1751, partial [Cyanobacteriota bacterium]
MKRSYRYGLSCLNIPLLSVILLLFSSLEVQAGKKLTSISQANYQVAINIKDIKFQQIVSTSAKDLLLKDTAS